MRKEADRKKERERRRETYSAVTNWAALKKEKKNIVRSHVNENDLM